MHILLIDDSSSTRSLLRTLINAGQSVRHEISEAASGEEALQKVASGEINLPDLVILDINMGGINGYELCREFRTRYGNGSDVTPYVIIVTANEGVEVINQALDSGANDYMPKPVNVKVLQVRLRVAERLLAHSRAGGGSVPAAVPVAAAPVDHSAAIATAVEAAVAQAKANHTNEIEAAVAAAVAEVKASQPDMMPVNGEESAGLDPHQALIAWAVEQSDAPVALVEAGGGNDTFDILYANGAMTLTTGFEREQLIGKSLSDLEAWTDDFRAMVMIEVENGVAISHIPLWSQTRQESPVYLSFLPVQSGEEQVKHYLVVHHL